jgi:DNA-binding transcriptional MerR regulator
MIQWYVKDLSKITGVSVQTLHHYDRIDLLQPSLRLPNGYRVYSEKDLLRLQQILALKFFGFELEQIRGLLAGKVNVRDHFAVQAKFLNEKAQALIDVAMTDEKVSVAAREWLRKCL